MFAALKKISRWLSAKKLWIWEVYFVLLIGFTLRQAVNLFHPEGTANLYFFILRAFDSLFIFNYFMNVAQVLLDILYFVPLALYIYDKKFLSPEIWKSLFILRLFFDVAGHSYEWNTLISIFYADPIIGLIVLVESVSTYIPSYIVCYRYAFQGKTRKLTHIWNK